jgi:hypothetical protein
MSLVKISLHVLKQKEIRLCLFMNSGGKLPVLEPSGFFILRHPVGDVTIGKNVFSVQEQFYAVIG